MDKDSQKKIEEMFKKGVLLNEDILKKELSDEVLGKIELESDLLVLNSDYADVIEQQSSLVDWYDVDSSRVKAEQDRDEGLYQSQLQGFKTSKLTIENSEQTVSSLESELGEVSFEVESKEAVDNEAVPQKLDLSPGRVTILISYKNVPRKYEVADFTRFFVSRYKFLESVLRNRRELQQTLTIQRILEKTDKDSVSLIGVVEEVGETKNGNVMLTLEDPTGKIKVLISKNNKDLFKEAKDIVADEVIGVSGNCGDKIVFADSVVWPDVPSNHDLKKGELDEYVIFLSDIHVGSTLFMEAEFTKFLDWISGKAGNEKQREIASKVRYVFIAGDLVDGVGIYPGQENELKITDIKGQYAEFCRLIKKIPLDKKIIICPGNHDAVHLAEPQPIFAQKFAPGLFDIPNAELVTNPALVNIGKTESFSGFDVLMYHGFSFDYYVTNVSSIRTGGGYHRADLIMKFLLKRRHLAPAYKSAPYYPSHDEDPLLIKKVPDFLITGHIHYSSVANYKGITMISGSCWQGKTTFQEKLGHEPEPARIPVVNLRTREIKIMRFA